MNIINLKDIQITQIPARMIESFLDVFKQDNVWRCRLKLKNGMTVPGLKRLTLNEYQLNNEGRVLLYKYISQRLNIAPVEQRETTQLTPLNSIDKVNNNYRNNSDIKNRGNFRAKDKITMR